jgi:DNA-binding XRE family transcriptional regulator
MKKTGIKQADMARKLGIRPGTFQSALSRNKYDPRWVLALCASLDLPQEMEELQGEYNFNLTRHAVEHGPTPLREEVRFRYERIRKSFSDVRDDIDEFYAAMGKDDVVAVVCYLDLPEEWRGHFIREAALHLKKGAYLLYVVPDREVVDFITRTGFPPLSFANEGAYHSGFSRFLTYVKNELHKPEYRDHQVDVEDHVALATARVPVFLCPGHRYVRFCRHGVTWGMGFYPFGRGSEEEHGVTFHNAFIPIAGSVVKILHEFVLDSVRASLLDDRNPSAKGALTNIETRLAARAGRS